MKKIPGSPLVWIGAALICTMMGSQVFRKSHDSASVHGGDEAAQIYYCPMHPSYHSDHPGSCPICHMDLVVLEQGGSEGAESEDEPQNHARIAMNYPHSHDAAAPLKKREMTIEEAMNMKQGEICLLHKCKHGMCKIVMNEEILRAGKCPHCGEDLGILIKDAMPQGYASVKLTADKEQLIGVKTEIVIKKQLKKNLRAVGTVAKDPDLYQAQAEYLQAREALEKAKAGGIPEIQDQSARLVESTKVRLQSLGLTPELISEIETRKEPDRSLLYAQPGLPVWIYARLYEYEIPFVKVGQDVEVQPAASIAIAVVENGKVMAIDPSVDPMTRTTRVRIRIEKPLTAFRPDMFTNVFIASDLGEVLSIPKDAVMDTGARQIVFVQASDGKYEPRAVTLGGKTDEDVEIKSGLQEGERVVVSGNFLMDSESRLKSALQSMGSSSGGHQHG